MVQRVIVTAAASGIGSAIAGAFAAGGARVHVCDVNDDLLQSFRAEHPEIAAARVNVADEGEIDAWFDDALDDLGGLDVLVNNAGIKGPTAFVDDISFDDWRECLAICLDSQFLCARRTAPVMRDQGSGSIINISSMAGMVGFGMRTPYAAAKWGVIGLTKSLAIELGPHNVRVNAICPGAVAGERIQKVIAAQAKHQGIPHADVEAEVLSGQSIRRFVDPAEVADLCVFLASPAAKMISGQAIAVDGHSETYHIG